MVNEGTRGRRFVIRVKLKVTLEGMAHLYVSYEEATGRRRLVYTARQLKDEARGSARITSDPSDPSASR